MKKSIGLVLFPGFQIVDMVAVTVFEVANLMPGGPFYQMTMLSEHGGPVTSSAGVAVGTERFGAPGYDTIMVAGTLEPTVPSTPALIAFLQTASKASRRTASICTGAFVLGEAGLLEGRRVTTHWAGARELQRRYPKAKVEEDRIFIDATPTWPPGSAGSIIRLNCSAAAARCAPGSASTSRA